MNFYENFLRKQTSKQTNKFQILPFNPCEVLSPDDDDHDIKNAVNELRSYNSQ